MKLPRDITGVELARALTRLGYVVSRQTGSHIRSTAQSPEEQHITSLSLPTTHRRARFCLALKHENHASLPLPQPLPRSRGRGASRSRERGFIDGMGTYAAILADVAKHQGLSRAEILEKLFD